MIDFEKQIITGKSGTVYRIAPDDISIGRLPYFIIQSATLGLATTFQQQFDAFKDIYTHLSTGNDLLGGVSKSLKICETRMNLIKDYPRQSPPKVVEFLALFCVKEGEDVSKYDEGMVRDKFDDWAHIPAKDFFLLASQHIPELRKNLKLKTA